MLIELLHYILKYSVNINNVWLKKNNKYLYIYFDKVFILIFFVYKELILFIRFEIYSCSKRKKY